LTVFHIQGDKNVVNFSPAKTNFKYLV